MMYDHFMNDRYFALHGFWFGPLHLLGLAVLVILPFWQIFSKAGYSGWLSFLMPIPVVNVLALYFIAFSDWPIHKNNPMRSAP